MEEDLIVWQLGVSRRTCSLNKMSCISLLGAEARPKGRGVKGSVRGFEVIGFVRRGRLLGIWRGSRSVIDSDFRDTRQEDFEESPTESHMSPSIRRILEVCGGGRLVGICRNNGIFGAEYLEEKVLDGGGGRRCAQYLIICHPFSLFLSLHLCLSLSLSPPTPLSTHCLKGGAKSV